MSRIGFYFGCAVVVAVLVFAFAFRSVEAIVTACVMGLFVVGMNNEAVKSIIFRWKDKSAELILQEQAVVAVQEEIQQTVEDVVEKPTDRKAIEQLMADTARWGWYMRDITSTPPKPHIKWNGDKPTILFGEGTQPETKPPRFLKKSLGPGKQITFENPDPNSEGTIELDQYTPILGPRRR